MISIILATIAALSFSKPQTLAGVTLGDNIARILSGHPNAHRSIRGSAQWWSWTGPGTGTITITADDAGVVTRVSFLAGSDRTAKVALPCVGRFAEQDSDSLLNLALQKTPCSAFDGDRYGLPDGSLVEVRFSAPDDGQLVGATWYRRTATNPSPVGGMREVLDYLRPVIANLAGARIYYAATCQTPKSESPRFVFPTVWLERPFRGSKGLEAVQQIFREDPNVIVSRDSSELPRITIGNPSTAILQTKINAIHFDESEQYTPLSAIDEIPTVPQVRNAERSLNVYPSWMIDNILSGPAPGEPHLPNVLRDVTVDQTLDEVARTFRGIVIYGVCSQPGSKQIFRLNFVYKPGSHTDSATGPF
jgi:hypothetical protein